MKTNAAQAGVWFITTLAFLLFNSGMLFAAGPPDGMGPGDHGRKKDSDEQGLLLGLIYGDQWVIVRDLSAEGDGKPIHFTWEWPPEAYNSEGDFDPQQSDLASYDISVTMTGDTGCVQPVSFAEVAGLGVQFDIIDAGANYFDSYGREPLPTYLIPLDPECKIPDAFAETWGEQVMEADAGRFNLSRSPQAVIDAAYEEALRVIDQALSVGLDPAGRLLLELEGVDEYGQPMIIMKTIDSPLENLALYQKILQTGCLSDTDTITFTNGSALAGALEHLDCVQGNSGPDNDDLLRAASFLAGAGDKTGRIAVDLLVYLNNRMELNEIIWSSSKQEITAINYYDFGNFMYDRCNTHAATTASLLQPDSNGNGYPMNFVTTQAVTLFDKRFTHTWPDGECWVDNSPNAFGVDQVVVANTPIINFVRAADDALSIINYIHNFALPDYPVAPVEEPVYP